MAEFASRGVAGSGLGLGIAGTALGLLNGGLGNLGGVFNNNGYHPCVSHYELSQESKIAKLESEVALRDANIYNDQKLLEMYKYFDGEVKRIDKTLCEQATYNAAQTGAISCIQGQIAQLYSLTKFVIPNNSICPGWGEVTVTTTPAATTTTTG